MELNEKQLQLCLEHALAEYLQGWHQSATSTWDAMQRMAEVNPHASGYEAALGIVLADRFEDLRLEDLVEEVESTYYSHQRFLKDALVKIPPG